MASSKELADRMESLRLEYIQACKDKDIEHQQRILRGEKELALQIGNEAMKINIEARKHVEKVRMPRILRVIEYYSVSIDTGRGFSKPDIRERPVTFDTHDVEMISCTDGPGPQQYTVRMRSGRELDVNEADFNLIERAMRERE